ELHLAAVLLRPRRRLPHLPGPGHRPARKRRADARDAQLHGRHDAPQHDDQLRPLRSHQRRQPQLRLHRQRGRLDLRMPPRRGRLAELHLAAVLLRPRRRLPHLPGPGHRPARQPRGDARHAHPHGRPHPPPYPTPPHSPSNSGPSGATNDASPSFGFTANEAGSTFECRLDGGAWQSCTSPQSYSGLADGSHTFQVRATDPLGNLEVTLATRTLTVAPTPRPTPPRRTPHPTPAPPEPPTTPAPASASPPTRPARPSNAASTGAPGRAAPRRSPTPASPTAPTPSRSGPPTRSATSR